MSSTTYGFVTVDDHNDFSGDGQLTFSVQTHTGRSARSKQFDLVSDSGHTGNITVNQQAATLFITIDHYETYGGSVVTILPPTAGDYYIVGYANVGNGLSPAETSAKDYTDLNEASTGRAWTSGMIIIENGGTSHSGVMPETAITYGTDAHYTFKIPFYCYENETINDHEITFRIEDANESSVYAEGVIKQSGVPSTEET